MLSMTIDENSLITLLNFAEEQNFERLAADEKDQNDVKAAIEQIRVAIADAHNTDVQAHQDKLDRAIENLKS